MRRNYKVLALTAILAVGMAMAGCGASSSTASSTASSAASSTASSAAADSQTKDAVEPVVSEDADIDELQNGDSAYQVHAAITNVSDDSVTLHVYGYDAYEQDDVESLQVGDVIRVHNEKTSELEDVTITSLDLDNGYCTINGGIEEGGVDLVQDRGVYRTMNFDDYPVYYSVGEVTLPLADDVTLEDSSADPQAAAVESSGKADVARDIADSDNWTVTNTTVFVQKGQVFDVQRVWVP